MSTSTPTLLLLGCGGFIGSHLLDRLLADPRRRAIGVDLRADKIDHLLLNRRFTYVSADVRDTAEVRRCMEKCDAVVSLVAICNPSLYNTVPIDVIEANFVQPYELVKMCAEMKKRLIHFSTCEVYGRTIASFSDDPAAGEDPARTVLREDLSPLIMGPVTAQRWSYASAKQLLERAVYAYGFERGLEFTMVRPFNFIGPRMDYIPGIDGDGIPRVLACFMDALMSRRPLQLVDGGLNRRCFTYIDDAVDALMRIIDRPEQSRGETFNIGHPGNDVSIAQLADLMIATYCEICPDAHPSEFETHAVSSLEFYGRGYEDSDRRVPDISKARALLGWEPTTDLQTALRHTMAAYVAHYAAPQECRKSA